MDHTINVILDELKEEFGISKIELERIVDTEFRMIVNNINARSKKTVNLIHLGKFRPSIFFLTNYEKLNRIPIDEKILKKLEGHI